MNEPNSPKKRKPGNSPYTSFLNHLDEHFGTGKFTKLNTIKMFNTVENYYYKYYRNYNITPNEELMRLYNNGMINPENTYQEWQDKHETEIFADSVEKLRVNKMRPKKNIEVNVKKLEDLIDVINTHKYDHKYDYNIDLKSLHKIKEELEMLNSMIGIKSLKQSVYRQLMYFIQGFAKDPKDGDYKHTVITGPPGTGKTEIAKIIGKMYSKIGILKNNSFRKVTRTDLIAGYLGQTAIKTRKVIDEAMGGVLFIDEAYSLQNDDSYAKECVDTLCEAMSDHKNDFMVIIAGYQHELNETFFKINQGLESRFIWRFGMESYNAKEMHDIFKNIVSQKSWECNDSIHCKWFEKNKDNFKHNGRSMEQLFSYSKISHAERIFGKDCKRKELTIEDLDNGFKLLKEYGNMNNEKMFLSLYT